MKTNKESLASFQVFNMEEAAALMRGRAWEYVSDFDENGVLYWLGTNGRTTGYTNPQTSGKVVVNSTPIGNGTVAGFIGHVLPPDYTCNYTDNSAGAFVSVQLPMPMVITRYTLRHDGHDEDHVLRNWNFEGSTDGVEWVPLRQHVNDTSLAAQQFSTASWDANPDGLAFSHFRVIMTGGNSLGRFHLMMAGLELYGRTGFAPGTVREAANLSDYFSSL